MDVGGGSGRVSPTSRASAGGARAGLGEGRGHDNTMSSSSPSGRASFAADGVLDSRSAHAHQQAQQLTQAPPPHVLDERILDTAQGAWRMDTWKKTGSPARARADERARLQGKREERWAQHEDRTAASQQHSFAHFCSSGGGRSVHDPDTGLARRSLSPRRGAGGSTVGRASSTQGAGRAAGPGARPSHSHSHGRGPQSPQSPSKSKGGSSDPFRLKNDMRALLRGWDAYQVYYEKTEHTDGTGERQPALTSRSGPRVGAGGRSSLLAWAATAAWNTTGSAMSASG